MEEKKKRGRRPKNLIQQVASLTLPIGYTSDAEEFLIRIMNQEEQTIENRIVAGKALLTLKGRRETALKVRHSNGLGKKQVQQMEADKVFDKESGGKWGNLLN